MIDEKLLLENVSKDESEIENSCTVIIAHLMKFVGANKLNIGWVGSIGSCWKNIYKLSITRYRAVENKKINDIYSKAKIIYVEDGNKDPDNALSVVMFEMKSIISFMQWENLKAFMIGKASLRMDDEMVDYLNSYDPLKRK